MIKIENTIFISYRRANAAWALAIYQYLTQNAYDVFFDFEGIGSGDFERIIIENIRARAHFIILLTPSSLGRCTDPTDLLRREIETALDCKRNIVPLLLDGFDFQAADVVASLTGKIAPLQRYNGIRVPNDFFVPAMQRLQERFLNVPLDTVVHPISLGTSNTTHQIQKKAELATQDKTNWRESIQQISSQVQSLPSLFSGDVPKNSIRTKQNLAQEQNNKQKETDAVKWCDIAAKEKDLKKKLMYFDKALECAPRFPVALCNRGIVRNELGDRPGALLDLDAAINIDDSNQLFFANRGTIKLNLHDNSGAEEDFKTALQLDAKCWQAIKGLGIIHLHRGMFGQSSAELKLALTRFTETIRLNPNMPKSYRWRAETFNEMEDPELGLKDVEKYLQLGGGYEDIKDLESLLKQKKSVASRIWQGIFGKTN